MTPSQTIIFLFKVPLLHVDKREHQLNVGLMCVTDHNLHTLTL